MTKEDLSKWLDNIFNSCYMANHINYPDRIFLFYDKSIVRKIKLCKLNNIEFDIKHIKGECYFEFDFKYKHLMCDYDKIWSFLKNNYTQDYVEIQDFIRDFLLDKDKKIKFLPQYYGSRSMKLEYENIRLMKILLEKNCLDYIISKNNEFYKKLL